MANDRTRLAGLQRMAELLDTDVCQLLSHVGYELSIFPTDSYFQR